MRRGFSFSSAPTHLNGPLADRGAAHQGRPRSSASSLRTPVSRLISGFGELQPVQPRVFALAGKQVVVVALLHDAALLHGADSGGALDGAETVGDDEGGAVL